MKIILLNINLTIKKFLLKMGCSNTRENLENEIMQMQIKRLEIQMEKYNELQKLS